MNSLNLKKSKTTILSLSVNFGLPDKYSYEIDQSFADLLTVRSRDPSIKSNRPEKVVFVFRFQSEVILQI